MNTKNVLTDRLLAEIFRMARAAKVSNRTMLGVVSRWRRQQWVDVAVGIGRRPPHADEVTAILAGLSRAAFVEKMAEAS